MSYDSLTGRTLGTAGNARQAAELDSESER